MRKKDILANKIGIIFLAFVLLVFSCVIVGTLLYKIVTPYPGISSDAVIVDLFLCEGVDDNGSPIGRKDNFISSDWEKIYVCINLESSEPTVLGVNLLLRIPEIKFVAVTEVKIWEDGYIYVSVKETIEDDYFNVENKPLFFDEDNNVMRPGNYFITIYNGRTKIGELDFEITE